MIFIHVKNDFVMHQKSLTKKSSPSEVNLSEETMYKILIEQEK